MMHKVFGFDQEGFPIYVQSFNVPSMKVCFKNDANKKTRFEAMMKLADELAIGKTPEIKFN